LLLFAVTQILIASKSRFLFTMQVENFLQHQKSIKEKIGSLKLPKMWAKAVKK